MTTQKIPYKIYLEESEMPKQYYNLRADMQQKPASLLNPQTKEPMTAEELGMVFCQELVKQELDDTTRYFDIPQEIQDFYRMYRPAPLVRAYCLEEMLDTPAKIYYKFEGNNTSGSHKLNSAITQAYYAKAQGQRCHDRNWCRTMGYRPVYGLRLSGSGVRSVHGQRLLRTEATPQRSHGYLRRKGNRLPF